MCTKSEHIGHIFAYMGVDFSFKFGSVHVYVHVHIQLPKGNWQADDFADGCANKLPVSYRY